MNKKVKSASIPDTVSIGGCTFQVTSIGAGAFKGMKKLKKLFKKQRQNNDLVNRTTRWRFERIFIGWFFIITFKQCNCHSDIDKNTIICYIHIYDTYMRICGGVM